MTATTPPAAHAGEPLARAQARPASNPRALRALVRRGALDGRRGPLAWGGALGVMSGLTAALYPTIEGSFGELLETYPEGLREAFGIQELDSVEAFLGVELFSLLIPLAVGFYAIRSISRALAVREESGELDTLLAAPVSRRVLVGAANVVAAALSAAVLAVTAAVTWPMAAVSGAALELAALAAGVAAVWPLAVFFAGLATLVAGGLRGSNAVTGIAAGALLGMYLLDAIGKAADGLEPLRWASAFRWYGSAIRDGVDVAAFAGVTLAGALLAAAGALLLDRRDLHR